MAGPSSGVGVVVCRVVGVVVRLLYLALGGVAAVAALVGALSARNEAAVVWRERRGLWIRRPGSEAAPGWVWIHAASVGEAEMALALAARLRAARPGLAVVVSTMTAGGLARLRKNPTVESHYFPIDFPVFVKRILAPSEPLLFVAIETEIWPETLRLLQARKVPVAVVNARISDRSWPRYRFLRPLLAPVLSVIARVAARDDTAARRWIALGAGEEITEVTGNMKFDLAVPGKEDQIPLLLEEVPGAPLLLAASTHEGEDELALDAFAEVRAHYPQARLLLAPRHPRRAGTLLGEARSRWLAAVAWSDLVGIAGAPRSPAELAGLGSLEPTSSNGGPQRTADVHEQLPPAAAAWPARVDVLVLDRIGLLRSAYLAATACFVGGSLVEGPGGHNLLEPAVARCPSSCGPHLANVTDQVEILGRDGALTVVTNASDLSRFWIEVIENPEKRLDVMGQAGRRVEERCGALERNTAILLDLLKAMDTLR